MNIGIFSKFENKPEWGPGWQVYSGIRIYIKFPDTSALEYELLKYPTTGTPYNIKVLEIPTICQYRELLFAY